MSRCGPGSVNAYDSRFKFKALRHFLTVLGSLELITVEFQCFMGSCGQCFHLDQSAYAYVTKNSSTLCFKHCNCSQSFGVYIIILR